jgi:hypothetical protein
MAHTWMTYTHHDTNVSTIYGEPRLKENGKTDLITKTLHKFNNFNRPWKWGQVQVTTVLVNMHPPSAICGPNMLSLGDILCELQKREFAHA